MMFKLPMKLLTILLTKNKKSTYRKVSTFALQRGLQKNYTSDKNSLDIYVVRCVNYKNKKASLYIDLLSTNTTSFNYEGL